MSKEEGHAPARFVTQTTSRFTPPLLPDRHIDRVHLLPETLPPLTLLRAPAGYGKTVLAAQWAKEHGTEVCVVWVRCAGLTVEGFWESTLDTLSQTLERVGQLASAQLASLHLSQRDASVRPAEVRVRALAATLRSDVVVVIDSFEGLAGSDIELSLVELLERSRHLRLIVASRRFAALDGPLMRTRVPTHTIRMNDLAFRAVDVEALAGLYGALEPEAVVTLTEQTAGWPMAVHAILAAEAQLRPDEPRLSLGQLPTQLSLVANDYLAALDTCELKRALLAVSLCPGLSPETFASALLTTEYGHEDESSLVLRSERLFHMLGDLGLVTRAWPPQTERFQSHQGLVAELRRQAEREFSRGEVKRLVRTHAADLAIDDPCGAIKLYCQVGEYVAAERLMLGRLGDVTRSYSALGETLRSIAPEDLAGFPVLAGVRLELGAFDSLTSDEWVKASLEHLRADSLRLIAEGAPQTSESATVALLLTERMRGDQELAMTLARDVERKLAEVPKELMPNAGLSLPLIYSLLGFTAALNGDFDFAVRSYGRSQLLAQQAGGVTEQVRALYGLALCACLVGEFERARGYAQQADSLQSQWAESGQPGVNFEIAPVRIMLASTDRDEGLLRRLRDELLPIKHRLECWPIIVIAEAYVNRRMRGAFPALSILCAHLGDSDRIVATTPYLKNRLTVQAANLQIVLGDFASAKKQLSRLPKDLPERRLATARIALLQGSPERAARQLYNTSASILTKAQRCECRLLSAVASWQLGFTDEALHEFALASDSMVEHSGFRLLSKVPYEPLVQLAAEAETHGVRGISQKVAELPETMRCQHFEKLSPAELRTIHALAEGDPLEHTAATLYISFNTLKFHLRNIYRKLRVSSREEAVRRALRMGLLSKPAPVSLGVEGTRTAK